MEYVEVIKGLDNSIEVMTKINKELNKEIKELKKENAPDELVTYYINRAQKNRKLINAFKLTKEYYQRIEDTLINS